jgi:hypothetical protein
MTVSATSGSINCYGEKTSVTISASGGTSPYTGTGVFTAGAGKHVYYVSDAGGNRDSVIVTLSQPQAISASLTAGSITTAGGSTSVIISASGGTGPYTYNINGGIYQAEPTFNNLTAGTYTFNTRDFNGCTVTKSIILAESTTEYFNPRFKVSIWPNPTTNYFKLQVSKIHGPYTVYIDVFNSQGMWMYSTKGDIYTQYTFGDNFPAGSYYVKVKIGTGVRSLLVVKL